MRVLLHFTPLPGWQRDLSALASLHVDCCDVHDDARFHNLLSETEVLWHVLRPISPADIARAPKLRLIQKIGVGVNTIDLEAAKARGIAVCNMPGTNSRAVAEMTLLLILACLRRLPSLDRAARDGSGWSVSPETQDAYDELAGKTVGLVGYGAVAQILSPILEAMDAHIIYTSPRPKPGAEHRFRQLSDLLHESDIVSLHVPLTSATTGIIGREQLAMTRPGAILINTARGALVDQAALVESLQSGRLAAAGLDVFAEEPAPPGEPLLKLDNVVVTPHLAWLTAGTWRRSLKIAAENCRRLSIGEPLLHRVV
jgi:phosphoglycerate dehydrogenase-like enzyme